MAETKRPVKEKEPLNVFQRLNRVREKVRYIQKDAKVQDYTVVSYDALVAAARNAMIEEGVFVIPNQIVTLDANQRESSRMVDTGFFTSRGSPIFRYEALYEVGFISMDDPKDRFAFWVEVHANDTGDKGPGKANTYATKIAMLKVLFAETGDTEESREELREMAARPLESIELEALRDLCQSTGTEEKDFLSWVRTQHPKVDAARLEELPRNLYSFAYTGLQTKKRKAEKQHKEGPSK